MNRLRNWFEDISDDPLAALVILIVIGITWALATHYLFGASSSGPPDCVPQVNC